MSPRFAAFAAILFLSSCGPQAERSSVPVERSAATPAVAESVPEAPACGGAMCYEIIGNKMILYNTPGETNRMETEIDMPPDVASMKRSLMVYDKDGKTDLGPIDIQIDQKGVKSISMRGKPIAKKE